LSGLCCSAHTVQTILPSAILVTGILGSWHCLGMCGGLVFSACQTTTHLVIYHVGRWLGYCFLGALAGLFGAALGSFSSPLFATLTAFLFGSFLIYSGISTLLKKGHFGPKLPLEALTPSLKSLPPWGMSGSLGFLSAFLPCGFLYSIVLSISLTHDWALNIILMTAFWAGTLPILAVSPGLFRLLLKRYTRGFGWIMGVLMIVSGLISITLRFI
jgi:sulfite exporter TauE/SafE